VKTCNQGWWREELVALNGFDERMQGWGREDDELAARAFNAGMRKIPLRFAGLAVHLHHAERHLDGAGPNDGILAQTRASGKTRCEFGLDGHMARESVGPGNVVPLIPRERTLKERSSTAR
jgi:hypothetical protein